jgi:hypothetical protein
MCFVQVLADLLPSCITTKEMSTNIHISVTAYQTHAASNVNSHHFNPIKASTKKKKKP